MKFGNNEIQQFAKLELTAQDFLRVREMVYDYCGINLHGGKEALVRARLMKRLRKLKFNSFTDYLDYVESDSSNYEFISLIDVLTTNKTSFFRESQHFDFIQKNVLPAVRGRQVKWWSAGCSSGEEPVTMAITLNEYASKNHSVPVKILATDISTDILKIAKDGIYGEDKLSGLPKQFLNRYFQPLHGVQSSFQVNKELQQFIKYGRLNLLEDWPLKGPFQIIMCRNVMIYFDKATQEKLVQRFHNLLEPGGYLFIGHSESITKKDIGFINVRPAVYKKMEFN